MADEGGDIRALVQSGQKIQAIKLYRERYGVGLKEAKDVIDAIAEGKVTTFPSPITQASHEGDRSVPSMDALNASVDGMLRQGQKIEAIKLYRERTSLGLKEAKDAVDAREAELRARGDVAAKSGCFIATAAFGAEDAPEVLALRRFRDAVLVRSDAGRRFIRGYYHWSPPLAEWLGTHPLLCRIVRGILRLVASLTTLRRR